MSLQVIGAGLGRTGTTSLKQALEHLWGGPGYHMLEVRERAADPDVWGDAYEGRPPAWRKVSSTATERRVDWPAAPFWSDTEQSVPRCPHPVVGTRSPTSGGRALHAHHLSGTGDLLRS